MGGIAAHRMGEGKEGGMNFMQFAQAHGLIINSLIPFRWVRVPTVAHPRKRNGAYKFMETHGFVQEHSTMTEPALWKPEGDQQIDIAKMQRQAKEVARDIEAKRKAAAERAEWILSQCSLEMHPYLERKGFKNERANVWSDGNRLVIPMRVGRQIVGCQLIDEAGDKKFLLGQRTGGAAFVIDSRGPNVLCEGYATALSIRAALAALKRRYTLFVCFSAHNMKVIAKTLPSGFVIADNDASKTGEKAAQEIGWPYFMPPTVGHDFNDFHQQTSLFKVSQALRASMT